MPSIPNNQTITRNLHQDDATSGGFARSNQFQVYIGNGWGTDGSVTPFIQHLNIAQLKPIYGFTWDETFQRKLSINCFSATLPSSTNATGEMKDQFQGVVQEYAHTRINTDIDFSFYVDRDYTILMFFEAWMNFIAGGNSNLLAEPGAYDQNIGGNYYRRFNYPKHYMNSSGIYITKFEKNYNVPGATDITYQLVNAFPKAVNAVPVQYGNSEVMRVTIKMYYDRYRLMRNSKGVGTSETNNTFIVNTGLDLVGDYSGINVNLNNPFTNT